MNLSVRRATPEDFDAVFKVREEVFVAGQGVPADIERDSEDATATHVLAEADGVPVGTGRLLSRGDIGVVGRLAVVESARGAGVGAAMLSALEQHAVDCGQRAVELHAQLSARGFYDRAGYVAIGAPYVEAGIEHITMGKALPQIRAGADADSAALLGLIAACWAPYPGCVLDIDGEEPWLRAPASAYEDWQGVLWVATADDVVIACAGIKPHEDHAELKSLYVAAAARRRGLGERLSRLVEGEARRRGYHRMELWTDTRFADAHRLYERLGYVRLPVGRELHDVSNSVEHHYAKDLSVAGVPPAFRHRA